MVKKATAQKLCQKSMGAIKSSVATACDLWRKCQLNVKISESFVLKIFKQMAIGQKLKYLRINWVNIETFLV